MRSTVIIPQPIFLDFNRDGQLDAAARIDERIYYFLSSKKAEGRIRPFCRDAAAHLPDATRRHLRRLRRV
jgi:hypothetical protein